MVNLKNILLNKQLEGIQILIVELVRRVIIEISRKKDICYLSRAQSGKRVNLC
ncbi:hypothetical protein [Bacillus subtilis]|uniref:hypothetical protein n=1 Tax=Bacillus subtilis TaxID=1423 RepID=UPI00100A1CBF|nr:hypothetical protein [Bacillus subtilis]MBY0127255.1 hypothetical protein [Bacillus subtilis]MCM3059166.1 hypothetical protein [Bacillus subtilis]MEC0260936.1 hypothetical protein [Bacillus subtilis]QAW43523.1 hypothetical protein ETL58_19140 [Bacillus subtilis]UNF69364.1 hypothetical protein MM522_16340 [Bacillus subtilis]